MKRQYGNKELGVRIFVTIQIEVIFPLEKFEIVRYRISAHSFEAFRK